MARWGRKQSPLVPWISFVSLSSQNFEMVTNKGEQPVLEKLWLREIDLDLLFKVDSRIYN
jgi:hypothetical protein